MNRDYLASKMINEWAFHYQCPCMFQKWHYNGCRLACMYCRDGWPQYPFTSVISNVPSPTPRAKPMNTVFRSPTPNSPITDCSCRHFSAYMEYTYRTRLEIQLTSVHDKNFLLFSVQRYVTVWFIHTYSLHFTQ